MQQDHSEWPEGDTHLEKRWHSQKKQHINRNEGWAFRTDIFPPPKSLYVYREIYLLFCREVYGNIVTFNQLNQLFLKAQLCWLLAS